MTRETDELAALRARCAAYEAVLEKTLVFLRRYLRLLLLAFQAAATRMPRGSDIEDDMQALALNLSEVETWVRTMRSLPELSRSLPSDPPACGGRTGRDVEDLEPPAQQLH